MTIPVVVAATPLPDQRLQLRFDDGVEGVVALADVVPLTGVFEPLAEQAHFSRLSVDENAGTVVWPNGADLDPLVLYSRVTGRSIDDLLSAEAVRPT